MSEENQNKPIFIQLNACDIPEFKELKNSDWVQFGHDNMYPQRLIELYDRSATHNSIITGKVHYIAGEGLRVDDAKVKNVQDVAEIQGMIKKANPDEGLESIMLKAALDFELFNIIALEVIWKPNGKFDLYHVDASKIRVSKDGEEFAYSPDWTKHYKGTDKDIEAGFKTFAKYNPETKKGSQLYYHVQHRAGKEHYTLPEYVGAVPYIEIDYRIADYHLNNLHNGFQAGNMIIFSGQYPGDATAKKIEKDFAKKFQGTDAKQGGGVILQWQQEGEGETRVESLMPNNFDKQFMQLLDQTRNMIFTGHRVVSPNLFGVETDQPFGNRTEIVEKMEVFQSTYVSSRQRILNGVISDLYNTDAVYLDRVDPITEQFSETAVIQIATALGSDYLSQLAEKAGLEVKSETVTQTVTQMSKDDKEEELLFSLLEKMGRPAKGINCKYSKELDFSGDEVNIDEDSFRMNFEVTDFDKQVLGVLKNNPTITADSIAEALNTDLKTVAESLNRLANEGLIDVKEIDIPDEIPSDTEEPSRELTEEGEKQAATVDFEIVYRYVKRASASGGDIIPGSRDFCRRLISLGRVYSKEDIDQMSAIVGHNVWLRRGGFWNRDGVISPSCRHVWRQELIEKQ
jgi:hypothetical protein